MAGVFDTVAFGAERQDGARCLVVVEGVAYLRDAPDSAVPGMERIGRHDVRCPVDRPGLTAEADTFADAHALLGVAQSETPEQVATWLEFHARAHGATAAILIWRGPPPAGLADAVPDGMRLRVVTTGHALGIGWQRDLTGIGRRAGDQSQDEEDGPFVARGLFDAIRKLWLQRARAILHLDPSEVLHPRDTSIFDATAQADAWIEIAVKEAVAWRHGDGPRHADHVNRLPDDPRVIRRWAVAPRIAGETPIARAATAPAEQATWTAHRCIGIAAGAMPVAKLVDKSRLVEDPDLVALSETWLTSPRRAPRVVAPRRKQTERICVVTTMRNEGPFIVEWIAHQKRLGVDDILVYTNDCDDGTDRLLDALAPVGVVRRDNPGGARTLQHAALAAAEHEPVVRDAGWIMVADVDEFLDIHVGDGRLPDLFAATGANAISPVWRLFGNDGIAAFSDRPVTEQFTRAAPELCPKPYQAWGFKTVFRNDGLFQRLGVHRPHAIPRGARTAIDWILGSGTPLPPPLWDTAWRADTRTAGYALATLNHYAVRSAESYLVKRDRGRVNRGHQFDDSAYWDRMNRTETLCPGLAGRAPQLRASMAEILALPGVNDAHHQAVAWHRQRIAQLRRVPDYARLFVQITAQPEPADG